MSARLRYLHYAIVNSFWFIPAIMLAAAVLLAGLSAVVDRALQATWSNQLSWVFWVGPDGARTILQVIAGSMIGATSLVFSMTLIALTLASSQLGPRLLAIFRGDRMTQVALGFFVATLAYALLMLRLVSLETEAGADPVPLVSVTVAQLLTLCSLAVLIYFIHHLAELLESDTIVSHVGLALDKSVCSLFPESRQSDATTRGTCEEDALSEQRSIVVPAGRAGYIQTIAREHLARLAERSDTRIELAVMPGDFLVINQPIARIWPHDRANDALQDQIRESITIGPKRTQAEDLEYAVNALVEIALRALSPSLNDPFTAIACINRIGASLTLAIARSDPTPRYRDAGGKTRLVIPTRDFVALLNGGYDDIRGAAREHPAVLRALARMLCSLADQASDPQRRAAIERQGEALRHAIAQHLDAPLDRERVEEELSRLAVRLKRWDASS